MIRIFAMLSALLFTLPAYAETDLSIYGTAEQIAKWEKQLTAPNDVAEEISALTEQEKINLFQTLSQKVSRTGILDEYTFYVSLATANITNTHPNTPSEFLGRTVLARIYKHNSEVDVDYTPLYNYLDYLRIISKVRLEHILAPVTIITLLDQLKDNQHDTGSLLEKAQAAFPGLKSLDTNADVSQTTAAIDNLIAHYCEKIKEGQTLHAEIFSNESSLMTREDYTAYAESLQVDVKNDRNLNNVIDICNNLN